MQALQRTIGAGLVLGLLVVASLGFAVAQGLKATPPRYTSDFRDATAFSPTCGCATRIARFGLSLTAPATLQVRIVTAGTHRSILTLLHRHARGRIILRWNGSDQTGARAPDGAYQVAVAFAARPVEYLPNLIRLDTTPPVISVQAAQRVIAPGAPLRVTMASNEAARGRLVVFRILPDGTPARVWPGPSLPIFGGAVTTLTWPGQGRAGHPAIPDTYIVGFVVRDPAGNQIQAPTVFAPGQLAPALVVRVRSVDATASGRLLATVATVIVAQRRIKTGLPGVLVARQAITAGRGVPEPRSAGLYTIEATVPTGSATGFQAVAGAARVLVVVPLYTWQANANPYDARADGFPPSPPGPYLLDRPLPSLRGLLASFVRVAGPVLRSDPAMGAITDQVMATRGIPRSVKLLVLVGERVYTPGLVSALRGFLRRGGSLALLASPLDTPAAQAGGSVIVSLVPRRLVTGGRPLTSPAAAAALAHRIG